MTIAELLYIIRLYSRYMVTKCLLEISNSLCAWQVAMHENRMLTKSLGMTAIANTVKHSVLIQVHGAR